MSVSFNGFNEKVLTFKTESAVETGYPVMMSGNGTVAPCDSGDDFCGIAVHAEGKYVSVQLAGAVTVPYTGTAPEAGYATLSAGADGSVAAASGGREYLVLSVDTVSKKVTFVI